MDASPQKINEEILKTRLYAEEPVIITGSGANLLNSCLLRTIPDIKVDSRSSSGRARELLEIANNAIIENNAVFNSGPVYIRKSDAELSIN